MPSGSSIAMPQPSEARAPGASSARLDADEVEPRIALVRHVKVRRASGMQQTDGKLEHGARHAPVVDEPECGVALGQRVREVGADEHALRGVLALERRAERVELGEDAALVERDEQRRRRSKRPGEVLADRLLDVEDALPGDGRDEDGVRGCGCAGARRSLLAAGGRPC